MMDMTSASVHITHQLRCDEVLPEVVKAVLAKGAVCRFQAKGHSMSPFIKDGDVVTISPMSNASPGFGDVIAFIHPRTEKLVIHRAVRKIGDACVVKGENAFEPDGVIERKNIIGIITKVERKGRRVFFGLGPERFLIALLTRKNLLLPILIPLWRVFRPVVRLFLP
jgi:SOS-response transcriptional repressor LexA